MISRCWIDEKRWRKTKKDGTESLWPWSGNPWKPNLFWRGLIARSPADWSSTITSVGAIEWHDKPPPFSLQLSKLRTPFLLPDSFDCFEFSSSAGIFPSCIGLWFSAKFKLPMYLEFSTHKTHQTLRAACNPAFSNSFIASDTLLSTAAPTKVATLSASASISASGSVSLYFFFLFFEVYKFYD